MLNQQKPHPPHEVVVTKKNLPHFEIFHCIPYELLFLKKLKCRKNHTCEEAGAHLIFINELWKTQKIRTLKKWKKKKKNAGDIIILHMCIKNHNHMEYSSWDMKNEKLKLSKKLKKPLDVPQFYTGVPKIMISWCTVSEMWWVTDRWTDRKTEKVTYRGECST